MFPLRDDNPTKNYPYITVAFIVINIAVFIMQLVFADGKGDITTQFAVIPVRFTFENGGPLFKVSPYVTLLSYNFLHGGFLHLAFNMLFLWIFGNNIEDTLGRIKFILFYLVCGVAAALLHITTNLDSPIQMVGASGAIAGILGAYLILFPFANIDTLFVFFFIIRIIKVPAIFFIGFWFFIQIISVSGGGASNIAWFAHIGGFIAGVVLILIFKPKKKKKPRIVYH
jgi:membrane associated rhomboid family serine protease